MATRKQVHKSQNSRMSSLEFFLLIWIWKRMGKGIFTFLSWPNPRESVLQKVNWQRGDFGKNSYLSLTFVVFPKSHLELPEGGWCPSHSLRLPETAGKENIFSLNPSKFLSWVSVTRDRFTKEKHTNWFKFYVTQDPSWRMKTKEMVKAECFYIKFDEELSHGKMW